MVSPDESTNILQSATIVRYAKTRISIVQGPDSGTSVETVNKPIRVGTAPENDLVLADKTVSRRHCAVEPVVGGFRIRDEGSTNGLLIADARVYDAVFNGKVQIRMGDTVLAVEPMAETVEKEQSTVHSYGDLLGRSSRMRELFADLARIAPSDVTLLIEGETGTGKELVAETVHQRSPRAEKPYVVFDCGAVAPTLAESELFGHEKGAFTGAIASRPGVFEQASGGTIFLDELAELPRDLQPKLLRVLEKHEVRRLGAQRYVSVDVRVVAATNRNLAAEVACGNFREDLYFRIAGAHVYVPPLRDRMDDLRLLVEHFLRRVDPSRTISDVPLQVWEMFQTHRWPGNVRELSNAVQRFLVTPERALGNGLPRTDAATRILPKSTQSLAPLRVARREASDAFERAYLIDALERAHGNVTRAAAIAEVSRQMVQKLMRKHDIG